MMAIGGTSIVAASQAKLPKAVPDGPPGFYRSTQHAAPHHVQISVGDRFSSNELSERDHFLSARWMLFSVSGDRHRLARAWHTPW